MSIYQADEWVPGPAAEAGDDADLLPAADRPGPATPATPATPALAAPPATAVPRRLARVAGGLPCRCAAAAGRLPLRWRIMSLVVAAGAAAAAATAAAQLAGEARHDAAMARARAAATAAARTELRQILSYDYRSIGADLARARASTTGEFRGQFGVLASQLIGPAAIKQHTVTVADVPDASVITATADRVEVLLFIDQRTTSKLQPHPQFAASQVRVTMQRVGGRWLVAQFQAL